MIGEFSTNTVLQERFLEKLPRARRVLTQFRTLDTLFASFNNYERKDCEKARNIILGFCLPDIRGSSDTESLAKVEEALLTFNVANWKRESRLELVNRLRSDDYTSSSTAYTELTYAKWLADRLGRDKVEIHPRLSTGKKSDIFVKLDTKRVYLELGNLGPSIPETKIKKILDEGAMYLGLKLRDHTYLLVTVDAAELLVHDSEKHIDEGKSIEKLASEIDRLRIDMITEYEGVIDLDELVNVLSTKELWEPLLKKMPPFVFSSEKKAIELIDAPATGRWINSCEDEIVKGSKLIKSVSRHNFKFLLVEIHTELIFPSAASLSERDSFIRHFISHVQAQLGQLQPGHPNIIVVQGFNWVMLGLGRDLEELEPLRSEVKKFLNTNKQKDLSGIAVFERDFAEATFIPNEQAEEASKLTIDEIERLGMRMIP
jgi:hypothetical protein